jgi:2-polyprenyl-6-methoxyphenol hydroxylase-like FAD-dependent oxidoreductase
MYDVVVVGARCAGAATALLLARRGHRVLLLDRAAFPSDMALSTHLVWPRGVAKLTEWGLGEALAGTGAPPLGTARMDFGELVLEGPLEPAGEVGDAWAPRRSTLDGLLVEAAVAAGAELREHCSVQALISDGDGVTGVHCRSRGGRAFDVDAQLVVGADGMHSTVAALAGAAEYRARPPLMGTYFSYFTDVPTEGIEFYPRDWRAAYGWRTDDDLTLVGANWNAADYPRVRADPEAAFHQTLADIAPGLAERVQDGRREARFVGCSVPNCFRVPFGPGWALVGDAGYLKDPSTAQGISDAFDQAEQLAHAIDDGLTGRRPMGDALAGYAARRDEDVLPMYEFTCALAPFAPPPPELAQALGSAAGDPARTRALFGVFGGTTAVADFFGG